MVFLLSLVLLTGWTGLAFPYHLLDLPAFWNASAAVLVFVGEAAATLFFLVFPDGHFVPRWTRWFWLVSIVGFAPFVLFPYSFLSLWSHTLLNALASAGVLVSVDLPLQAGVECHPTSADQVGCLGHRSDGGRLLHVPCDQLS
jgi:hypothetical protein